MRNFFILTLIIVAYATTGKAQGFIDELRRVENGKGSVTIIQSQEITDLVNGTPPSSAPVKTPPQPHTNNNTPVTVQRPVVTPSTKQQTVTRSATHNDTSKRKANVATHVAPKQQTTVTIAAPTKPVQRNANSTTSSTTVTQEKPTKRTTPVSTSVSTTPREKEKEKDEDPQIQIIDTRKKVMRNSYKTTGYRIQVFSGGNSRTDRLKAETAGKTMKANFPNEPVYIHFYSPSWKCRMGNYTSVDKARSILKQVKGLGYTHACIVKGKISVQY